MRKLVLRGKGNAASGCGCEAVDMAEKNIVSLKGKIEELTAKSAEHASPSLHYFDILIYFVRL